MDRRFLPLQAENSCKAQGGDNLLLRHRPALRRVRPRHENILVLEAVGPLSQGPVRRMRQYDAVRGYLDAELLAHIRRLLALQLPAAVGEERKGDVVLLEEGEGLGGAGDRLGRAEEDAVDAEERLLALGSLGVV